MTGDGILKTTTDTITAHIVLARHGTGADITARSTVHAIVLTTAVTGTAGDITARGATTATTVTAIPGTTADSMTRGTMTRGTTAVTGEDTMEVIMPDISDGMTHGTTTTTAGITLITAARPTLQEVLTSNPVIMACERTQKEGRSQQEIHPDQQYAPLAAQSGEA